MSIETVKRYLLAATLVAASGCGLLSDEARITLGRHEYCVPKEYILNSPLPRWLKSVAELPHSSPEISLIFPAAEVARNIKGFEKLNGQLADDLIVGVELLDAAGVRTYSDPELHIFSNVWYGRGRFEDAVVGPHPSGLYQVGVGWRTLWKVVRFPPDPTMPPPDDPYSWYIGGCVQASSQLTRTNPAYSCSTMFLHEDLRINIYFDEINLPVVDEIQVFVVEQLESWALGIPAVSNEQAPGGKPSVRRNESP
ncbi:MAG: hypothetical protein OXF68_14235 [Gammaproteobacteria bacterium]|nr:hypothetical protein [Gammaproteobacteria bacterium]